MASPAKHPFQDPFIKIPGKLCDCCQTTQPVEKFAKGSYECRDCIVAKRRNYADGKSTDEITRRMIGAMRQNKIKAPHVTELCDVVIEEFGGLREVGSFIVDQVKTAGDDDPGGKKVLDGLKAIINLVEVSTKYRGSAPDMEGLTDNEIEDVIRDIMGQIGDDDDEPDVVSIDQIAD